MNRAEVRWAVLELERAALQKELRRAERAETALKKALAHIEELETVLRRRIQDGYLTTDDCIHGGVTYLRECREQCQKSLRHAGEKGFQSDFELRLRLEVLDDLIQTFSEPA